MKRILGFILCLLPFAACAQWSNAPIWPGKTPGLTPQTLATLVKKPTNDWANGYVITTYDSGTTSVAVLNDASGVPVEEAARIAADAGISNTIWSLGAGISNDLNTSIDAKADSNLVWSTFATTSQVADVVGVSSKADSNLVWSTFYPTSNPNSFIESGAASNAFMGLHTTNFVNGQIMINYRTNSPTDISKALVFRNRHSVFPYPVTNAYIWYNAGNLFMGQATQNWFSASIVGSKFWTQTNDGSASGMDADLLDGFDSSYFRNWANITNAITFTNRVESNAVAVASHASLIDAVELYTNRAALAADSSTVYGVFASYYPANNPSNYLTAVGQWWTNTPNSQLDLGDQTITNIFGIYLSQFGINFDAGSLDGNWSSTSLVTQSEFDAADSTTNYVPLDTYAPGQGWSSLAATQNVDFGENQIINARYIRADSTNTDNRVMAVYGTESVAGVFSSPDMAYYSGIVISNGTDTQSTYLYSRSDGWSELQFVHSRGVVFTTNTLRSYPSGFCFMGNAVTNFGRIHQPHSETSMLGTVIGAKYLGDASALTNFPSTLLTIGAYTAFKTNAVKVYIGAPTGMTQSADVDTGYSFRIPTNIPPTNIYFGGSSIFGAGTNWRRLALDPF